MSPLVRKEGPVGAGLDALVAEALTRSNMLIHGNLRRGTTLACGLLLRGRTVAVSDVVQTVRRLSTDLRLVPWNMDGECLRRGPMGLG